MIQDLIGAVNDEFDEEPFLRVPPQERERVSARDDVHELRALIVSQASMFDVAEWLAERDITVTVTTFPDLPTTEWLCDIGGPEHWRNLDKQHRELGLPPVLPGPAPQDRAAQRRKNARKAVRKARRASRRR